MRAQPEIGLTEVFFAPFFLQGAWKMNCSHGPEALTHLRHLAVAPEQ